MSLPSLYKNLIKLGIDVSGGGSTPSNVFVLQGDWNANTNTPNISGTTETGYTWHISVAGSTDLGGITDWNIGDLAVKTSSSWIKIDNTEIDATWGSITGTLSNQTDLNSALNGKESSLTISTGLTRSTNTITSDIATGKSGGQTITGGTAASESLTIQSTSNATKGSVILDSKATLPDGTAAAPAVTFTSDPDTGIYRKTTNTLALTANGVEKMSVNGDSVDINSGAVDVDFIVKKLTSGNALVYDAGTDTLTITAKNTANNNIYNSLVITQATHGFVVKDVLYHNGTIWAKAKADDEDTLGIGIVTEVIDTNNFRLVSVGHVVISSHGFTVGQYYYLSAINAGALSANSPAGITHFSAPICFVADVNTLIILPWRPVQAIMRNNDTRITITTDATYNISDIEEMILADSTSGNITVNLPTPSASYNDFTATIKKIVAANTVTIKCASGNIDGTAGTTGVALTTIYDSRTFVCDGTNYWIK